MCDCAVAPRAELVVIGGVCRGICVSCDWDIAPRMERVVFGGACQRYLPVVRLGGCMAFRMSWGLLLWRMYLPVVRLCGRTAGGIGPVWRHLRRVLACGATGLSHAGRNWS